MIGRVNNPRNAWLFTPELGVDVALNQADIMAKLIEEEMSLGDMMTIMKLRRGKYSLVEERSTRVRPPLAWQSGICNYRKTASSRGSSAMVRSSCREGLPFSKTGMRSLRWWMKTPAPSWKHC